MMSDSDEEYDSSDSPAYFSEKEDVKLMHRDDKQDDLSSDSSDDDEQELNTSQYGVNDTTNQSDSLHEDMTGQLAHSPLSESESQLEMPNDEYTSRNMEINLLDSPSKEATEEHSPPADKDVEIHETTMKDKQEQDNSNTMVDIEQAAESQSDFEEDSAQKDNSSEELEVFDEETDKQEESSPTKKRKRMLSSDSEDDESQSKQMSEKELIHDAETAPIKKQKLTEGGDDNDSEGKVSDIGSDDDEMNEQQVSELQEEVADLEQPVNEPLEAVDSDEDDDQPVDDDRQEFSGLSDWEVMMARRKEAMARTRRKRRKDIDITANDDYIMSLISKMRLTAEQDRQLNLARKPATKKLQLLPTLLASLKKADLQTAFIECGILSAVSEWLTPLPDHSLPHLKIRDGLLEVLKTFPVVDAGLLKSSKIGKAVMLLYKHPKETRRNRERAGKIVNEWARPIFGLASDFKSMSRDEREKRDYSQLSQAARRRLSSGEHERRPSQDDDLIPQKPGDKGWIGRARVPMPSTNDYVVRPKWNVEQDFKKSSPKKVLNRYEKHLRKQKQKKMQGKSTHAASLSIEGRHMPL